MDNIPSLRIYEKLGFIRTKRLHRYYLNGNTAFRLILYLKPGIPYQQTFPPGYDVDPGGGIDHGTDTVRQEDLIERQAAQMRIEDVHGERHDVRGSNS